MSFVRQIKAIKLAERWSEKTPRHYWGNLL